MNILQQLMQGMVPQAPKEMLRRHGDSVLMGDLPGPPETEEFTATSFVQVSLSGKAWVTYDRIMRQVLIHFPYVAGVASFHPSHARALGQALITAANEDDEA